MSEKTEIELLRERATKLGIDFHPNLGVDKLKKLIDEALADDEDPKDETGTADTEVTNTPKLTPMQVKLQKKREAEKLLRVVVNCMNPNKREWEGELISAGNSVVGQFRKFVPFNNEAGWHIPQIIYNAMKERECQIFVSAKDERGNKIRKSKMIKEFSIDVLEPLSEKELKELAAAQARANAID
jgi:hypothetical protein